MSDIASAYVALIPHFKDGSIQSELKKELGKTDTSAAGKESGLKFGSAFKGAIAGVLSVATLKTIGNAVVGFTKQAVAAYSDYEQLAGGAAKIFDEMDQTQILTDAGNAWRDLNMSANDYMASINDVGAMFSATMGDQKAYDTARIGMKAISDYATGTGKNLDLLNEKYAMITRATSSYQSIADQFAGILPATSKDFLEQAQAAGFLEGNYKKLTEVPIAEYQEALTKMLEKGTADLGLAGNTAAETAKTISGSLLGLKGAWTNWLAGLGADDADMEKLTSDLMESLENVVSNVAPRIGQIFATIGPMLPGLVSSVIEYVPQFVGPIAGGIAAGLQTALSEAMPGIDWESIFSAIGDGIDLIAQHPEAVAIIAGLVVSFKAMQGLSSVAPVLSAIGGGISKIAAKALPAAAGTTALAAAERAEGAAAAGSAAQTLAMGAAILMIGAGVAIASVGMALLAQSAIAIAEAGPGAGVAMLGMVAGLVALVGVLYLAGPALTASAVGMIAFGAAVLLVGAGVLLACAGITLLSGALPMLAECGATAAAGMIAVGAGAIAMGALVMAGCALILAGGAMALAGGALFVSAGALMLAGGAMMIAAGALAVAFGAMLLGAVAGVAALNLAIGDLGDKVGAIGWGFQSVAANGGAATASLFALAAAAPQVAGGFNDISNSCNGISGAMSSLGSSFSGAASSAMASSAIMAMAVIGAIQQMQSAISSADLTIQVKLGPLPHFHMSGQFDAQTGAVPTVGVDWYKKGGVFTGPSVIGVGEAGDEAVIPLNSQVLGEIADGINKNGLSGEIDYMKLSACIVESFIDSDVAVKLDGTKTIGSLVGGARRRAMMNG